MGIRRKGAVLFGMVLVCFLVMGAGCPRHDEGTASRFDRVTFLNASGGPVDMVKFQILKSDGLPWWEPPLLPELLLGPVPDGGIAGRGFNHGEEEEHDGVARVVCTVEVGPETFTCTVEAELGLSLNGATFWLCPNHDGTAKLLSGHGVMSETHTHLHDTTP